MKVCVYFSVVVFALLGIGITLGAYSEGDYAVAAWAGLLFVIALPGAAIWAVHRCKVACAPTGLEVINLVRRRKLGWHEIAHAQTGYYGIVIDLKNGHRLTASAVQKTNVSKWLNRHTRADDLVDLINSRVSRRP